MSLFDIPHLYVEALSVRLQREVLRHFLLSERSQPAFKKLCDPFLVVIARNCYHDAVSRILFAVIRSELCTVDPREALRCAEYAPAQRIAACHELRYRIVHVVVRTVLDHLYLFTDDLSLLVHLLLVEARTCQHIEQDLSSRIYIG